MDDARGVSSDECGRDLDCYVECFGQLEPPVHVLSESDALDKLSGDKRGVVDAADLINSKDVGMIER